MPIQIAYSFPNYSVTDDGIVINNKTGKILTPVPRNGYLQIRLSRDKKTKCISLHRLIYQSFKGKIKDGYHINHTNGIRGDNRLTNLEEVTPEENNKKMLFLRRGIEVNTNKITESQVMEIRKKKAAGVRTLDLMKEYKLSRSTITRIAKGKIWKHLPILPVDNTVWSNRKLTGAMAKKTLEEKYGEDYFSKIAKQQKFKKHCETCTCIKPL